MEPTNREVALIDEADNMTAQAQVGLYRALEDRKVFGDPNGSEGSQAIPIDDFSLICCTNNEYSLVAPLLVVLAGIGIMWLWQYAYSPQGRARVIIAQLKKDDSSLRGWLLKHHLVRPGFSVLCQREDEILHDPEIVAAADEMVKLGHEVLPVMIESLHDDNRDVQATMIWACGKTHDPAVIQSLAKRMRDAAHESPLVFSESKGDVDIQLLCMYSLVEIGSEAYGTLMDASKECDSVEVRGQIPRSLAQKWGTAAVPYLIRLLEDSLWIVRANAADELGNLKDKRAIDSLIRHLTDDDPGDDHNVGIGAAFALGKIGDPKAIPALKKLLNDPDSELHDAAAEALKKLGDNPPPASQPASNP